MKQIIKIPEPRSFLQHRASGGTFSSMSYKIKEELRQSLEEEQGFICCYCMKRIPQKLTTNEIAKNKPDCKIEHFKCQTRFRDQELNYQNLLLSCNGNHGFPHNMQTCDTFKDDYDLTYHPSSRVRNIENLIKYKSNGEIYSEDGILNRELSEVLNLNTKDLRDTRRDVYLFIQKRIILEGKRLNGKAIQKRFFESEKDRILKKIKGKLNEYCMIGVYLINKKLRQMD